MKTIYASFTTTLFITLIGMCAFRMIPEVLLELFGVSGKTADIGIRALKILSFCCL